MTLDKMGGKNTKGLGELEAAIMQVLWKIQQGTVRDVLQVVGRRRDLAYTTVMTVMGRMVEKGYLSRQELQNGSFEYRPCSGQTEFYAAKSRSIAMEMIRNFGAVAVAQFVDALEEEDPQQLALLRERLRTVK